MGRVGEPQPHLDGLPQADRFRRFQSGQHGRLSGGPVVDVVAPSLPALLKKLDGYSANPGAAGSFAAKGKLQARQVDYP